MHECGDHVLWRRVDLGDLLEILLVDALDGVSRQAADLVEDDVVAERRTDIIDRTP